MNTERVRYVTTKHFLNSAKSLGITLQDGLNELVDNSIDANAHQIKIYLETKKSGKHRIMILDDGCGIASTATDGSRSFNGLEYVLAFGGRIPHPHNPASIGRFGWGLSQTASCLSDRTEVYTKTSFDPEWRYSYYDYLELENHDDCFVPEEVMRSPPMFDLPETGTLVILDDIGTDDYQHVSRMANMLKKTLGRVYRNFLGSGAKIDVILTKKTGEKPESHSIEISDPLMQMPGSREYEALGPSVSYGVVRITLDGKNKLPMIVNKRTKKASEIRIHLVRLDVEAARKMLESKGIVVASGVIGQHDKISKMGINMNNQGFCLVRNGREISSGLTLEIYQRTTLHNWFRGQIEFDEEADALFNIQTNKSRFSLRRGLQQTIADRCRSTITQITNDHRKASKDTQRKAKMSGVNPSPAEVIAAAVMPMLPRRKNISDAERKSAAQQREHMVAQMIEKVERNPDISVEEKAERITVIRNRFAFTSPCRKFLDVIGTGEIFDVRHMADECDIIINTATPFYDKVYEKITQEPEMESLVDLFLFSMGYSEHLASDSKEGKQFWVNARRQVSQIAYQFVALMPSDGENL
jgi:hypothetical protein